MYVSLDMTCRLTRDGTKFLQVGAACYSKAVGYAKVKSQEKSTMLEQAYSMADKDGYAMGMEAKATDFESRISEKVNGTLRLHFVFPHAVDTAGTSLCIVRTIPAKDKLPERTEIIVNIDKEVYKAVWSGISEAFDRVGKLMAALTSTPADDWVDGPDFDFNSENSSPEDAGSSSRRRSDPSS